MAFVRQKFNSLIPSTNYKELVRFCVSKMNIIEKRLDILLRHQQHVRDNCEIVGRKLIEKGESELGLELIKNGQIHDNSKFEGIQWLYMHSDVKEHNPDMFKLAVKEHVTTNPHHPEHWNSIHDMGTVYIAEFCCDISARSSEFGTDVNDFLVEKAFKKYNFNESSLIYKQIQYYLNLLLEPGFK